TSSTSGTPSSPDPGFFPPAQAAARAPAPRRSAGSRAAREVRHARPVPAPRLPLHRRLLRRAGPVQERRVQHAHPGGQPSPAPDPDPAHQQEVDRRLRRHRHRSRRPGHGADRAAAARGAADVPGRAGVLLLLAVVVLGERLTPREWGCAALLAAAAFLLLRIPPGSRAPGDIGTPPPLVVAVALPSLLVPCVMRLASDRARRGAHARPLTGVVLAV